ncbi:hypothetical protein ACFQX7_35195 [Luedemannella flava]
MSSLARHLVTPAETGPALRALSEWTPADAPAGGLHPGTWAGTCGSTTRLFSCGRTTPHRSPSATSTAPCCG